MFSTARIVCTIATGLVYTIELDMPRVLVQTAKISKMSSIPKINESPTTPLIKISAYPTDRLIEPFAYAYLIFGLAIPIQISQQLTPQPTKLLQIPKRIRMPPQKPILIIHQTIYQPKLIMA